MELIIEVDRDDYTAEEWRELAQEPVTRCRDCAYRDEWGMCRSARFWGCATDDGGFCHEGERRRAEA